MLHVDEGTLNAYLDDALGEQELREIGRHLEDCSECRDRLEEAAAASRQASDLLAELEPGALRSPAWRDLEQRAAARTRVQPRSSWPRPALAWAASVMLAFTVGWLSRSYWIQPAPSPLVVAEQEQALSVPGSLASLPSDRRADSEKAEGTPREPLPQPVAEPTERFAEHVAKRVARRAEPSAAEPKSSAATAESVASEPRDRVEAGEQAASLEAAAASAMLSDEVPTFLSQAPEGPLQDSQAVVGVRAREAQAARPDQVLPVQPEAAAVWLRGEPRTLRHLRLQRIEVLPGTAVPGASPDRAVVRQVYRDADGSEITLIQQRLDDPAERGGDGEPTLVVEPDGHTIYRWHDGEGYLLMLQGEVGGDALRALAERVE